MVGRTAGLGKAATMWALVLDETGPRFRDDVAEPVPREPEDVIVRVAAVMLCSADLDICGRSLPGVEPGRVLGHQAVGTVERIGEGVRGFSVGDRVVVSCVTACGRCRYCWDGRYGGCPDGGWRLGRAIDGTHAELVRVPHADHSLHLLPDNVDDAQALMLSEVLPTAYEVGTLAGQVSPGDSVVIVGAGPVGLAAIGTSRLFTPQQVLVADPVPYRQQAALKTGADYVIDSSHGSGAAIRAVRALTGGLGADVVIDAGGTADMFELSAELIRPVGRLAAVGVHRPPATPALDSVRVKDATVTTGLVDTYTTPRLIAMVSDHLLELPDLVTHRFAMDELPDAYDVLARRPETEALEVVAGVDGYGRDATD